jgi:hypothetical protein
VVTVKGLSNEDNDELKGKLGGHLANQKQKTVYLQPPFPPSNKMRSRELVVEPKNIYFKGDHILDKSYKLIDFPNQLDSVPLHKVVMSDWIDMA